MPAIAAISGPYQIDAETVHLFHLDETSGSTAANSVINAPPLIAFNGQNAVSGNTAQPQITGILGAIGTTGFSQAASFSNLTHGLGLDANASGGFQPGNSATAASPDSIAHSSLTGNDGSFTLEALIQVPNLTAKREIISTDSSLNNRCFQFYLDSDGTVKFNFIGGTGATVIASIPTSGPHAFVANEWFHIAYTYQGGSSLSTFYWTRLADQFTQANALSTSGTESMIGSYQGPLVIGNEGRSASGEGLLGLIDEVRISRVARQASQFLFSFDDSDNDGLSDAWEILHFGNLSQSGSDDPDQDGYDNNTEKTAGTLPNNRNSNPGDTDSDGLPDTWEITHFGSITAQTGSSDSDGDFASNADEYLANTNPTLPQSWPDRDADRLNDGWEKFYFAHLDQDGSQDSDSDGATDREEHEANSHPLNASWTPQKATLAHRWSFNGSLADSIGETVATLVDPDGNSAVGGSATLSSSDVSLSGGASPSSAYIKLGNGGLLTGRRTPVTIELWATQVSLQNWSRIFDFGSSTSEYLMMSWTRGTTSSQDQVRWLDIDSNATNDTIAPYGTGVQWHIVMSLEPRAGTHGRTRVTWHAAPANARSLSHAKGSFYSPNTLHTLNDAANFLGRSQFPADNTASARYDEVRIWNGALSPLEREGLHAAGPDTITLDDSDLDGLPDAWEIRNFGNLSPLANADPDGDFYDNATELLALSDPNIAASNPLDLDADGLADLWETSYFGSLAAAPSADPDGDTESNFIEQSNRSAPNNKESTSIDADADSLPDAWEIRHFSTLTHNGGADPDRDGFGNLQEFAAATQPANSTSRPAGPAVKLVPLDDGDHASSDFGYGGSSAINSVAFVRSSLKTVGDQQFITWYGRHQFDPNAPFNNTIWIGRRTLGSSEWEIFRHPTFTANAITDGHDVISYGIDGAGYMHLSWGMHGDAFHYSRSTTPVTGAGPILLGPDTSMTGLENAVTYPQFLKLPNGDLNFIFREIASGNGDTYINRYDLSTATWSCLHAPVGTKAPFIKGSGWSPNYNAYLNMPQLGGTDGNDLIITWCWRFSSGLSDSNSGFSGYQTNNHLNYARSNDGGLTWQRFGGATYALPITRDLEISAQNRAEVILSIPEGSSLINQASTCIDANDNPVTCTWWAPNTSSGNFRRQYRVVFRDDQGTWQARSVSNRLSDPTTTRYSETNVRDLGRPIVVADDEDRLIVAYRDNQSSTSLTTGVSNGITVVHSLPKSQDPQRLLWIQFDLTQENLGNYEPIIDNELWDRDRQLHFLYQPASGQGYTAPSNTASRISVLEWDAAAYFSHESQASLTMSEDRSQITINCPSQPSWGYRLWSSTNLTDWAEVETRAGTGLPLVFTHTAAPGETQRFWRIQLKEGGFQ